VEGGMTLYHFTREKNLPGIAEHGLLPGIGENSADVLTLWMPVVWSTTNRSPLGWLQHFHDDACCLTVEPRKKKLFHWRTWLRDLIAEAPTGERIVGADVLEIVDANAKNEFKAVSESFYVYPGTIPRSRIKVIEPIHWSGENEEVNALIRDHQETLRQMPWGAAA
jgi:hypothetical protein